MITDGARTPEFYARAGLPANESSLYFRQDEGFVYALDLCAINRPEWRSLAAELAFRAMGFHTLRHVGTADHLHVSVRLFSPAPMFNGARTAIRSRLWPHSGQLRR